MGSNEKRNMSNILPTILIIENDPATLYLYCRELSRDYTVISCSEKNEALETVGNHKLDALVLEPVAWNGQGWELLDNILVLPTDIRSFPVVVCSVQDERKRGLEMGAAAFLVKPVSPVQLLETLHHVIGRTEIIE